MAKKFISSLVIIMVFLVQANTMDGSRDQVEKMTFSPAGLKLIERFEGFRGTKYNCVAEKSTIGFGHVVKKSEEEEFAKGLSREDAEKLLIKDLGGVYLPGLERKVKVPLTQWQFDALTSFIYNLGETNLGESTLLELLNEGKYDQVAPQFPRWCFAQKKYYPGLFKRRLAEMYIFQDHTTIPYEFSAILLGKTGQSLLEAYQNLEAGLKEEAVKIYQAYKANWPDSL